MTKEPGDSMDHFQRKKEVGYAPFSQYQKSNGDDIEDSTAEDSLMGRPSVRGQRHTHVSILPLSASWIIIVILAFLNFYQWRFSNVNNNSNIVYSPAQSAVRYKNIVTNTGLLKDLSPYQGPRTNESDRAWTDLYNFGISRISRDEAEKLANRTVPIPSDPEHYVVTLNVFHHLHCLNMIRQRVWLTETERPPIDGAIGIVHMDHCIDQIRQSLMCSADITPRPYGWDPEAGSVLPINNVVRTCRDYDAIREWALERRTPEFNFSVQTNDPLGNVVIAEEHRQSWENKTRPNIAS